jgi:hypothetical protein
MLTKKSTENTSKFTCENCDFKCSKQSYWNRHIITSKHIRLTTVNALVTSAEEQEKQSYDCEVCNKIYKSRVGLWKHSKQCKPEPEKSEPVNLIITPETAADLELKSLSFLVVDLIKSNHDLQKQMLDVCQKIQPNTTTNSHNHKNSHNNSHNKTFNLQFFLNEQCKDAMNIMDFVNTFQLSLADFERIGEVGYVEGISNIVIDKLNQMDVYKRPIHCSDAKRETMHVKDNDVWVKDASANDKIRLALKHITKKNTDLIRPWLNAHPGVLNSEHRLNDKYQEMFIEAMGGRKNKNIKEGEDKIIKKICKMVLIDKNQ